MSLQDIRSECEDVARLLQPYVDGELSDEEQAIVATHLGGCRPCGAAVQEQAWVRATLATLPRPVAPDALRKRIGECLEVLDRANTVVHAPSSMQRWFQRTKDLARGGAVMIPAVAAAACLFWVAQRGAVPGELHDPLVGAGMAVTATPAQAADQALLEDLSALGPRVGFPVQIADPQVSMPRDVHLVGARFDESPANTAGAPGALLEYSVLDQHGRPTGLRVLDRQSPADSMPSVGKEHVFRGRTYSIRRDAAGRPQVQFEVAGVAHNISLHGPGPRAVPAGLAVDRTLGRTSPEEAVLLHLADRLRRAALADGS